MSTSKRVYDSYLRVKTITQKKGFKFSLMSILTIFLFFFAMNAYAADDEGITFSPDWDGTKTFYNEISGVEETDDDNMTSHGGLGALNEGWIIVPTLVGAEMTTYGQNVLENPNIPYELKRGLIGLSEDMGDTAYALYPIQDIPQHLAQQWLPGYDETTLGLYATSGYEELQHSGIAPLWTRVINLAYVFFVLIMIIAGFMIMFRHKIGGQAMVTLGSVLPRVVIALVVATFSFAIAGIIIDLGGVLTALVNYILGLDETASIAYLGKIVGSVTQGMSLGKIFTGFSAVLGLGALTQALGGIIAGVLATGPGGWATIIAGLATGAVVIGIIGMVLIIIVFGIILFGAIKVLITLYKALFQLLLSVILGPIQITLSAIPGNSHMMKNWFLSVLRNVLVFPTVLFIVNVPNALMKYGEDINLRFPHKLVNEATDYTTKGLSTTSFFFLVILKVFVLFYAAQAPKFLESLFPPQSKSMTEGMANAQKSMSKIPFVGGMFKS